MADKVESKAEEKKAAAAEAPKEATGNGTIDSIIESIEKLSVLDLAKLIKALEDKFGVSAQAVAAAPMMVAGGAPAGEAAEEQTEFDVILASVGDKKIQVIKEVRAITSLGLKEAKELVDGAPKAVKEAVTKEEAEEIKAKLEEQGATIEIK
jgi:large subunit ribosomal protein L7/L12